MRKILAVLALVAAAAPAVAQQRPAPKPAPGPAARVLVPRPAVRRFRLEVVGNGGVTVLDINKWAGLPLNSWGTVNYGGSARLFLPMGPRTRLGLEAGYQYLFWWNYYPSGVSYVYEYAVTAMHVAGMIRLQPPASRFALDVGGGVHFFNRAGTYLGALVGVSYHLPLAPTTELVLGPRTDWIFTNPILMPIAFNIGLGFHL